MVHTDSDGTYGAPRVTAELRDAGLRVNHKRVQPVMRRSGIVGVHLRKKHRTTAPDPGTPTVGDRIGRDFTAETPNAKYVGDIAYLPVAGARPLCPATVIDLCSRRPAGWTIGDHMRADLVIDALTEAFNASLKRETLQGSANWATADQAGHLPLGHPLHHPPQTLPPRPDKPRHLRNSPRQTINHTRPSCIRRVLATG